MSENRIPPKGKPPLPTTYKDSLHVGGSVRIDAYTVIDRAVYEGVSHGWRRAWKHIDDGDVPMTDNAIDDISAEVMNALCEVLKFDAEAE